MLKKVFLLLLCIPLLCAAASVCAEPVGAFGMTADTEDTVLDFDAAQINVTDADALSGIIARMPNLQEVRMFDSTMNQKDMERLFDTYPDIFFGFTLHLYTHVIRTDVTAFSTLHHVTATRKDPRHTSEELSILRMCKKLKALDIGHNYVTSLDFLYSLPDIEVLILSPNYGGITDISPIANCKKLVYLECFNCPITDISPLSGLTQLRDVNLTQCSKVTDLSPLYDLPNLERVWWGHMARSRNDQRAVMRKLHPACKFVYETHPTAKGWRKHPHYTELSAFFRTGVYVPFSE